jgi:allophanate hydrolase subunit 1
MSDTERQVQLPLWMNESMKEEIRLLARHHGISMSEWIRIAIKDRLAVDTWPVHWGDEAP